MDDLKKQIESNEKKQSENAKKIDESKNNVNRISNLYFNFSKKYDEFIQQLKSDKSLMKCFVFITIARKILRKKKEN